MKTKNVDIRYIETRKVQFLDGTEHYPEFYIHAKFTGMVYLQNGKCCRLEVIGSADNIYDTGFEASIHFGGKAYDLTSDKHIDILAKRLGCQPFSIWRLHDFIHEKVVEMCHELSYFHRYDDDELDAFSIEMNSKVAHRFKPAFTKSESVSDYTLKVVTGIFLSPNMYSTKEITGLSSPSRLILGMIPRSQSHTETTKTSIQLAMKTTSPL